MKRNAPLQRKTPLKQRSERKKRCPSCQVLFKPQRAGQAVCGEIQCAVDYGKSEQGQKKVRKALAEIDRKEIKARKEALKSRSDHMREAQIAFNAWIRLRDAGQPCISCGTTADVQYCAGHYRTTAAAPELRFEPLNVHLQCNRNCNMGRSGNLLGYRPALLDKIGAEALAWLEGPHEPRRYTIEDLKQIKAHYRAKTRELKRGAA